MFSQLLFLLLVLAGCVLRGNAQVTATVTCTSCTSYQLTIGTSNTTYSCPTATICNTTSASLCASSNTCGNGVVSCISYGVFPSPTSCQQFYVCRYRAGYGTYVLSTVTCPGASQFDSNTLKCTLSPFVNCYPGTGTTTTAATTIATTVPTTTVAPVT